MGLRMRLIDADELMPDAEHKGRYDVVTAYDIANAPTVDAVEVVRCKDCIYRDYSICYAHFAEVYVRGDDYCSRGRKNEAD